MRESGFTLFELVVTLGVIGILAAIAIPSFAGTIARSNAGDLSVQVYTALNQARIQAITTNQVVPFTLNQGCSWTQAFGNRQATTQPSIGRGVQCIVTGNVAVNFRPDGSVTTTATQNNNLTAPIVASISGGGALWTVSVATNGQITKVLN